MHTTQTPRALVTVDGFTISNFLGADFFTAPKWAVLAPDDIARAEIIYGPTSARYSGHSMGGTRSEEHTSELQSLMRISYAVFCLKQKTTHTQPHLLPYKPFNKQTLYGKQQQITTHQC